MKVAICGCAVQTLALAPFDDPTWEIWAHGASNKPPDPNVKRWDVWWDTHDIDNLRPEFDAHVKWLSEQTKPVYLFQPTARIPNARIYDYAKIVEEWGKEHLTSTAAWMMAGCIMGGVDEIGLFGVEMATNGEYGYQRAGIKAFQTIATKYHGIKVTIPPQSHLAQEKAPYPFSEESPTARWIAEQFKISKQAVESLEAQGRKLEIQKAMNVGAEQAFGHIKQMMTWHDWAPPNE